MVAPIIQRTVAPTQAYVAPVAASTSAPAYDPPSQSFLPSGPSFFDTPLNLNPVVTYAAPAVPFRQTQRSQDSSTSIASVFASIAAAVSQAVGQKPQARAVGAGAKQPRSSRKLTKPAKSSISTPVLIGVGMTVIVLSGVMLASLSNEE